MLHILVLTIFTATVSTCLDAYAHTNPALLVSVLFGSLILFKILQAKRPFLLAILLALTWLLVGHVVSMRAAQTDETYYSGFVFSNKEKLSEQVRVDEYPNYRFANNQYVLRIEGTETRILTNVHPFQKYGYLDVLQLQGSLADVRMEDKEWHAYYRKLGVHYTMFLPQLSAMEHKNASGFFEHIKSQLFAFKMDLRERVMQAFSSQASALVLGMLLGERDELSKEEKDMFNAAGLSHILVVSGYNISLMITFIFAVFKWMPKHMRILLALLIIFLFVVLVGTEPSVTRAALMGSIIIFSKVNLRPGSAVNVLFLVAIIMLGINPFSIFDAGFHLSFIATYALLIMPDFKKIPEFVAVTAWVFLFVSPYIMYLSGSVSVAGIASNLLVTFLLAAFMLLSLSSLVLSYLGAYIGIDVLLLETMSRYVFIVAEATTQIGAFQMNTPPSLVTAGYIVLGGSILYAMNRYSTREFIEKRYQKYVPQRPS